MAKKKSLTDKYQNYLIGQGKSPNTVKAYGRDVRAFARWWEQTYGQTLNPQAVTSPDIQEYRGYLVRGGLKPATVNRRLIALRRFFAWLKRERQITDSPFEVLEKVLIKEQRDTAPRWLTRQEQLALMRAVRSGESKRDLAVVQTLLGTGLRISELAALTVSDAEISDRKGTL